MRLYATRPLILKKFSLLTLSSAPITYIYGPWLRAYIGSFEGSPGCNRQTDVYFVLLHVLSCGIPYALLLRRINLNVFLSAHLNLQPVVRGQPHHHLNPTMAV